MGRLLRRTIAAISLILLLGTVGVWVRSYWVEDSLFLHRYPDLRIDLRPRVYELTSWRGRVFFECTRYDDYGYGGVPGCTWKSLDYDDGRFFITGGGWFGFNSTTTYFRAAATGGNETPDLRTDFEFPIWSLAVLLGVVPAFWLWGIWRRTRGIKQSRVGLCVKCGYDLRASSSVCPECGTHIDSDLKVATSSLKIELYPLLTAAIAIAIACGAVNCGARKSFGRQIRQLAQFEELKAAFSEHNKAKIELLLSAGAAADPSELEYAMRDSIGTDEHFAILMLDAGADLKQNGNPVLNEAIKAEFFTLARRLVEKGAPLNATYENGGTALELLVKRLENAESENPKMMLIELLLARGADPNIADQTGVTPLHLVAMLNPQRAAPDTLKLAQLLLDHGANINARDISDETPLHWAKFRGCESLAAFLSSKGGKE